ECFKNDIGRRCQAAEKGTPVVGFEVERYAALRSVVVPERQAPLCVRDVVQKRPDPAARLAAWGLDLDDIRPEITEQLAAELAGFVRQLQNANSGQWTRKRPGAGHPSISSWYGKRGRSAGQKVSSVKPERSSSWLNPSRPSTISRVCSPIIGLGSE